MSVKAPSPVPGVTGTGRIIATSSGVATVIVYTRSWRPSDARRAKIFVPPTSTRAAAPSASAGPGPAKMHIAPA
ncbi:MAG: hypothetical protein ACFCGT_11720 [Sandaracinaceae bacterium]